LKFLLTIFILTAALSCKPLDDSKSEICNSEIPEENKIIFDVIRIRAEPRVNNYWSSMPSFTFCDESRISRGRARSGISYWKRLGYPIENVRYNVSDEECLRDPMLGEVMIKLVTSDIPIHDNLAVTRVQYRTDTRQIQKAIIYVIGGFSSKERLIEHEIGHALGWGHYRRHYHIMHPEYNLTGHDSAGVSYISYIRQVESFTGQ